MQHKINKFKKAWAGAKKSNLAVKKFKVNIAD